MYLSLTESQKSEEILVHGDLGLLGPLVQEFLLLVCCLRHLVQNGDEWLRRGGALVGSPVAETCAAFGAGASGAEA